MFVSVFHLETLVLPEEVCRRRTYEGPFQILQLKLLVSILLHPFFLGALLPSPLLKISQSSQCLNLTFHELDLHPIPYSVVFEPSTRGQIRFDVLLLAEHLCFVSFRPQQFILLLVVPFDPVSVLFKDGEVLLQSLLVQELTIPQGQVVDVQIFRVTRGLSTRVFCQETSLLQSQTNCRFCNLVMVLRFPDMDQRSFGVHTRRVTYFDTAVVAFKLGGPAIRMGRLYGLHLFQEHLDPFLPLSLRELQFTLYKLFPQVLEPVRNFNGKLVDWFQVGRDQPQTSHSHPGGLRVQIEFHVVLQSSVFVGHLIYILPCVFYMIPDRIRNKPVCIQELKHNQGIIMQGQNLLSKTRNLRRVKYIAIGVTMIGLVSIAGVLYQYPELRSNPVGAIKASRRLWNVTYAGVRIAWIYKKSSEPSHIKHDRASTILRDAFYTNGGLWIKFGQIIGALDTLVPKEYSINLRTLNTQCPTDPIEKVKRVILQQTGKHVSELFMEFDQIPMASASIAQVHKARLFDGQAVAVKVQHQGLAESTRFDIEVLKGCIKLGEHLFQGFHYRWLVEQIEKILPLQLNFKQEASNLEKCRSMFEKTPNVIVPKVYGVPTQRLLVMEYMSGILMSNIGKIEEQGINKQKLRKLISKAFIKMIFVEGFVHADPHAGNILARKKEGTKDEPEIVLLDHGLYQKLDQKTLKAYCTLWMGIFTGDEDKMVNAAAQLGTKSPKVFCSMLTSKRPDDLKSGGLKKLIMTPNQQQKLIKLAVDYHQQIVQVLNQVNRQILLVFKVNDFAKGLENSLGGRDTDYYLEVAKGCFETLETPWWRRWFFVAGYYISKVFD